jgi:hypothetical protein
MSREKDPIKVLVRRAGQDPAVEVIENTLAAKQKIVGGMIEMPYNPDFSEGLQIVCDEEGKFAGDPKPNVRWGDYDVMFGDIFFVGIDENTGDTISLTPEQIDEAKKWIAENDASGFAGMSAMDLAAANTFVAGDLDKIIADLYDEIYAKPGKTEKDKGSEM